MLRRLPERSDTRCHAASRVWPSVTGQRRGTALVEFSVVLPVFGLILVAIMEFGHLYLIQNTLTAAAREGARMGAPRDVSSSEVQTEVNRILSSSFNTQHATVYVKDAGVFETTDDPAAIRYSSLSDLELLDTKPLQLFVVYIEVDYDDVALLPPFFVKNITLRGSAVMRSE